MTIIHHIWQTLLQFPDYIPGALSALTVLVLALPLYFGIWYFLHRRKMPFPWSIRIGCLGSFVLFAGLAFIFSSPLAGKIPSIVLNAYLFVACGMAAYTVVPLFDVFLIEYYLIGKRKIYISPPLRKVLNFAVFLLSFWPIMHFVMRFNPLASIAIPTIATALMALALQDTLKTFIAGIGLGSLMHVGDWIAFQDKEGRVEDINWGRTVLRNASGNLIYIPNTLLLAQSFTNYTTTGILGMNLKVNVAYSAPPERVKAALAGCFQNLPGLSEDSIPSVRLVSFQDPSVTYALFYVIDDYANRLEIQDELSTRVWEALRKENFELPAPFPSRAIAAEASRTTPSPAPKTPAGI